MPPITTKDPPPGSQPPVIVNRVTYNGILGITPEGYYVPLQPENIQPFVPPVYQPHTAVAGTSAPAAVYDQTPNSLVETPAALGTSSGHPGGAFSKAGKETPGPAIGGTSELET